MPGIDGLPEFRITPIPVQAQFGHYHVPAVCLSVGQRSLTVNIEHGHTLPPGTSLHLGIPVEPDFAETGQAGAVIWLQGSLEGREAAPFGGREYSIRLSGNIPAAYRRLVQQRSRRR